MKNQNGFTIIELLISLTLIAILSLVTCPAIYKALSIFTENESKTNLAIYSDNVIEHYRINSDEIKQIYANENKPEQESLEYKFYFNNDDDLKNKLKVLASEKSNINTEDNCSNLCCLIQISSMDVYKNNMAITLENVNTYEVKVKVFNKLKSNCYVERAGAFFTAKEVK